MKFKRLMSQYVWLLASLIAGLSCASCTKDEPRESKLTNEASRVSLEEQNASPLLTADEAGVQAVNLYTTLFSDNMRFGVAPKVKSVRLLSPFRALKDSVGGIYVVNFEHEGGYIMMAEHRGGEPILAASPKGSFDSDKALENPNLIPVLSNMRALVSSTLYPSQRPGEEPEVDDEVRIIGYGPWENVEEVSPLLPVEWGQGDPYNRHLEKIDGVAPPTGCVPTAVAQILSYYRRPKHLDWDKIILNSNHGKKFSFDSYSINAVATLLKDLGVLFNVAYAPDVSLAFSKDVPKVLEHYGIFCSPRLQDYSWDKVYQEFRQGSPVYIRGNEKRKTITVLGRPDKRTTYSVGHAWVLDGYKVIRRKVFTRYYIWEDRQDPNNLRWKPVDGHYYEEKTLVHCNFGWIDEDKKDESGNNNHNGYYLEGIFNTSRKPEFRTISVIEEGTPGYFQFRLEILTDIKPK